MNGTLWRISAPSANTRLGAAQSHHLLPLVGASQLVILREHLSKEPINKRKDKRMDNHSSNAGLTRHVNALGQRRERQENAGAQKDKQDDRNKDIGVHSIYGC